MKRLLLVLVLFFSVGFTQTTQKKVIVHCWNYGDGMGDYSSGLFIAKKFRELGCQVFLVAFLPTIMDCKSYDEEITDFFRIFEPSFSFYRLTRSDIFFYSCEPLGEYTLGTSWPNRLFSLEELKSFLPDPQRKACTGCLSLRYWN